MYRLLALMLVAVTLVACSSTKREAPPEEERPALGRISPLGLGNPDPEIMVDRALGAWNRNDVEAFLPNFAFFDEASGEYFVTSGQEGEPFANVTIRDLEPMKGLLFPLSQLEFQTPSYGEARNVRNNPPTVAVPVRVMRHFDRVSPERRNQMLAEINVSLRRKGIPATTWDAYVDKVTAMPDAYTARFVHLDGAWHLDAGTLRPGRF